MPLAARPAYARARRGRGGADAARGARLPLRLPWLPIAEAVAVRPAGDAVTRTMRWAVCPPPRDDHRLRRDSADWSAESRRKRACSGDGAGEGGARSPSAATMMPLGQPEPARQSTSSAASSSATYASSIPGSPNALCTSSVRSLGRPSGRPARRARRRAGTAARSSRTGVSASGRRSRSGSGTRTAAAPGRGTTPRGRTG